MKSKTDMSVAKYLLTICREHRKKIIVIALLLFLMAILNAALPILSATIIDEGLVTKNIFVVIRIALVTFFIAVLTSGLNIIVEHLRLRGYYAVQTSLKEQALKKLFSIQYAYFNKNSPTSIFQQLDEDIASISSCFSPECVMSLIQMFVALGIIPVLAAISWKLIFIMLLAVPLDILQALLLSKGGYRTAGKRVKAKSAYSSWFADVVSGMQIIRCYGIRKHFNSIFYIRQQEVVNSSYKQEMFQEINVQIETVLSDFLNLGFYILGGYLIAGDDLTLGQFVAFQTYSLIIFSFIEQAMGIIYGYISIKPSIERFILFLQEPDELNGRYILNATPTEISFENVSYSYENDRPILKDQSMTIHAGAHIAIFGRNGCGKTTLVNLLLRILQPQSGCILINGININNLDSASFRQSFAIAPQEPYLFCDTIENNICLFKNVPEEKLRSAIEAVGLTQLVNEKTLSYCVGQGGSELSGGQRQRISLARTIVSDSPVVVLDEPEARIDDEFENIFKRLMTEYYVGRTVIVISHNPIVHHYLDEVYRFNEESHEIVKLK